MNVNQPMHVNQPVPAMHIRRARPDDGEAVRRFVFETFASYGIELDPEGKDKDVMQFGEHVEPVDAFVAEIDGIAVGSVMVSPHAEGCGWLSKFFVDARFRGFGIGRALLAKAIEAGRARGYHRLELDTRSYFKEAIHLYEETGWRKIPDPPETGPCDVYYALDL